MSESAAGMRGDSTGSFRTLTFHGERSGSSALTWGQKWIWKAVASQAPHFNHLNLQRLVAVPECRLDAVMAALTRLVERHETLRTRFCSDERNVPRQVVVAEGTLRVEVAEVGEECLRDAAARLTERLTALPFTLPELSCRFGIVTDAGVPRYAVMVLFHMAADRHSADTIAQELTEMLAAGTADWMPSQDILQPLDRAALEAGEQGRRRSLRAVKHWEKQIERFPPALLRPRSGEANADHEEIFMHSRALHEAVGRIAAHCGATTWSVVVALASALLGIKSGTSEVGLLLFSHNRFDKNSTPLSGTVVQDFPSCVRVADLTISEIVDRTSQTVLLAGLCGQYDPDDLARTLERFRERTGRAADLACAVNISLPQAQEQPPREGAAPGPEAGTGQLHRLAAGTRLEFKRRLRHEDMKLFLSVWESGPGTMTVALRAGLEFLSRDEISGFLKDLERLSIHAVSHSHLPLSSVGRLDAFHSAGGPAALTP
ncbi:condensation domain-containing protein [Streptomyces sp. NPDC002838]|uniref:condensation domain-containing protein n=1 Tax=Streptomyces sp. NPDC002838 TaxID=3154436 RepID=UPI00331DD297